MENNNGRGIFYGVIGVATLIVAIIGATFAYFSASINSGQVVNTGSTSLDLIFTPGPINDTGIKTDIIPIDTDGTGVQANSRENTTKDIVDNEIAFSKVIGGGANECKDVVGNSICSIYEFTIGNDNAQAAQTIYGFLQRSTASTTMPDLYYAVFVGSVSDLTDVQRNISSTEVAAQVFNVHGTTSNAETIMSGNGYTAKNSDGETRDNVKVGLIQAATLASSIPTSADEDDTDTDADERWVSINGSTKLLNKKDSSGDTLTYTIVLWLEETYVSQADQEGQSFSAEVMFNTGFGQGVTGKLSL